MTDEGDVPVPDSKLTRTKERWAREGRFLTGHNARPDNAKPEADRLPPGQHLVRDWPVLDLGLHPTVSLERWRLHPTGAVENPQVWDWSRFMDQPQTKAVSDIHCVTTWSRYDND
jgi:DMSO/TMAO reductase YedYZ molybdopterin-dependent catalytic subunit